MSFRLRHAVRFHLERLLLRGAGSRLLFIAGVIILVTVIGGLLAHWGSGRFSALEEALWWAFLRLSDPGYLGDDEGLILRSVSTLITVLGYVLFLGSLVAILTQWLNKTIENLEKGFTPISKKNHVVILGWTTHTPLIVKELVLGGSRMRRFLRRHGKRQLSVAILSEQTSAEQRQELKSLLGEHWDEGQIVFRSGTPLRRDHLERVDADNAASIILPGSDVGSQTPDTADAERFKTLLSLFASSSREKTPLTVAEMFDASRMPAISRLYQGRIELVSGDEVISELMVQSIRNRGVSAVYQELCTHGSGNGLYIVEFPELEGMRFCELFGLFPRAVPLGLLRTENGTTTSCLNPSGNTVLQKQDRIAFMASTHDSIKKEEISEVAVQTGKSFADRPEQPRVHRRVLCLGWNDRMPLFLRELEFSPRETFELDILSRLDSSLRQTRMERYGTPRNGLVRNFRGDYIAHGELARFNPSTYDSVVVFASDRMASREEADARAVLGYHLLHQGPESSTPGHVLVEILDPENVALLERSRCEVITSPVMLSHMVAHVALRPELNPIFYQLLVSGGVEIAFHSVAEYGLEEGVWDFSAIQVAAQKRGDIALGVRQGGSERTLLNPDRQKSLNLGTEAKIAVLTSNSD